MISMARLRVPTLEPYVIPLESKLYFTTLENSGGLKGMILDKLRMYDKNVENKCEWSKDFETIENTYFLYDNTHLYGANVVNDVNVINGIPFYYDSAECTYDTYIDSDVRYKSGRLLRAFVLNHIYKMNNKKPFVYWGNVLDEAIPYNVGMGMKKFDTLNIKLNAELLAYIGKNRLS